MTAAASRRRSRLAVLSVATLGIGALLSAPAGAVNTAQSGQVSVKPAAFTPQVMNGSVQAIVQVGSKMVAAGTFTTVRQTLSGPDITRNGIFAFDATTGAIDPSFNPNLGGGTANSLDTDGTNVYVGGTFTSVNGVASAKKVAKLTAAGALVTSMRVAPNSAVNEVVYRSGRLYIGGAFSTVNTVPRVALAAVDPVTGAVLPDVNVAFAGLYNGGTTTIKRFDLSPDGTKLVAVGNFMTVGGVEHQQVAMLDTPAGAPAQVSSWNTNRFDKAHNPYCANVFDTFTRDLDFAPDGSYFVVSTTGAFGGGSGVGTLCDSTTRWETTSTGNDPTWVDYTGGDTTYGVAVTGSAIYVGGHMRWQNNSYQGDQAGPGAVARQGIAALDPVNGLPLSWNPGRDRGVGAQAMYATSTGLWVGSDTTLLGGFARYRLAFLPLAGGRAIPTVAPAALPNTLFAAQRTDNTTNVLYRVNAAGPALQSADGGPDWSNDAAYVTGGNAVDWGRGVALNSSVPAGTATTLFNSERWGQQHWAFPVTAGRAVTVRLYFANQYGGTSQPGQRVFNVSIDGTVALDHFDIIPTAGADKTGEMQSIPVTSDGTVDIDLTAITENPLINGIEIVDPAAPATAAPGALIRQPVAADGTPTGPATTANTAVDWSTVRGAFLVNDTMYFGLGDGALYARTFNKTDGSVGAVRAVNLHDDPDTGERIPFAIANMTGIFYEPTTHRIYYTLFGDGQLYYRYFTPESETVGAQTFTAATNGVDLSHVAGMTLAGGRVLYGSNLDGSLQSVAFGNGQLAGTPTVLSTDGTWKYRALLVPNS